MGLCLMDMNRTIPPSSRNFARISESAVTARVTTSDVHLWDTTSSAMPTPQNPGGGRVAVGLCLMDMNRTIPPSVRNALAPEDRLWDTSSSLPPTIRLEGKGNIASLCLMDMNCDTSSLSNSRLSELHATPAATNPTLTLPGSTEAATTGLGHSACEGNTVTLCLMGMKCRTSTQSETDYSLHVTVREMHSVEPIAIPWHQNSNGYSLAQNTLQDAQALALATSLLNAHASSTALSPTKADADGKP